MKQITSISVHPEIQDGAPVFSGTRIRVETFYDFMRIGCSVGEFLREFPSLEPEQVREVQELRNMKYSLEQLTSLVNGPSVAHPAYPSYAAGRVFSSIGSFRP